MAKDYAKYTTYRKGRSQRSLLLVMLGLCIGLFVLGLGLFLKFPPKQQIIQQTENKLKQKILEGPAPKPPEPKFDFYNILTQDQLTSSPQAVEDSALSNTQQAIAVAVPNEPASASSSVKKPLNSLFTSPEQVAIAEAKKQLDQEINQLNKAAYILVLGNFPTISQAEQYQAQALLKGFPVHRKVNKVNGQRVYQLFMGPYSGLTLASQQQKRLNAAGMETALLKLNL